MARSRSRAGARRWLAGAGLLAFGAVIGVMLGAILDGPRMLVRRWTEEVRVLELPRPQVDAPALEEYAKLQTRQPKPEMPAAPPEPAAEAEPRAEPRTPSAPGDSEGGSAGRDVSAPAPVPESASPEQLIAEIQQRRERASVPLPKPAPVRPPVPKPEPEPVPTGSGRSGSTVQVAAYRDVGAAETLVRRLRRAGYDAYVSDRRASGPNKYRVRVQPRDGSVKTLAAQLEERGYGVWITRE